MIEQRRPHQNRRTAESPGRCSSRRESVMGPRATGRAERRLAHKQQPGVSVATRLNRQSQTPLLDRAGEGESNARTRAQIRHRVVRLGRVSVLGYQLVEQSREGAAMSSRGSMWHALFAENSGEGILHEVSRFESLLIVFSKDQIVERG